MAHSSSLFPVSDRYKFMLQSSSQVRGVQFPVDPYPCLCGFRRLSIFETCILILSDAPFTHKQGPTPVVLLSYDSFSCEQVYNACVRVCLLILTFESILRMLIDFESVF